MPAMRATTVWRAWTTHSKPQTNGRELRAIPPKDPSKRTSRQAGMVSQLADESSPCSSAGYTIEEVAESLRGRGLDITTPTLKNYLQRAKSKTEKRAKSGGADRA